MKIQENSSWTIFLPREKTQSTPKYIPSFYRMIISMNILPMFTSTFKCHLPHGHSIKIFNKNVSDKDSQNCPTAKIIDFGCFFVTNIDQNDVILA